jgi:hypothetical protein
MHYVKVQYAEERDVYIDGQRSGKTNQTLMVEEGHHRFDLGEPADYSPGFRDVEVDNPSSIWPQVVRFTHKESAP